MTLNLPQLLSRLCTERWYALPPNRWNLTVPEDCKRCKNFAFPIRDFPCASYSRNHAHRHLVNTHLKKTIIHVHMDINQKPTTRNTSVHNLSAHSNNILDITDYSAFFATKSGMDYSTDLLIRGNVATCGVIHRRMALGIWANGASIGIRQYYPH
jgi:hypothetical protein